MLALHYLLATKTHMPNFCNFSSWLTLGLCRVPFEAVMASR